jgi:hypothetical protein
MANMARAQVLGAQVIRQAGHRTSFEVKVNFPNFDVVIRITEEASKGAGASQQYSEERMHHFVNDVLTFDEDLFKLD